jgi:hypothetical protein
MESTAAIGRRVLMETQMQIVKTYNVKPGPKRDWAGEIGSVELTIPDALWSLVAKDYRGKVIAKADFPGAYLAGYGIGQSGQDAYANAPSIDKAREAWTKRMRAIADDTVAERGTVDPVRALAWETAKKRLKGKGVVLAKLTDEQIKSAIDQILAQAGPAIMAEVERRKSAAAFDVDVELPTT